MRKKKIEGLIKELLDIQVRALIEREVSGELFSGTLPDGTRWEATVDKIKVAPIEWESFECTIR